MAEISLFYYNLNESFVKYGFFSQVFKAFMSSRYLTLGAAVACLFGAIL